MHAWLTSAPILLVVGAALALTIEHGWGWILAKIHSYRDEAVRKASDIYGEIQDQVTTAVDVRTQQIMTQVEERIAASKRDLLAETLEVIKRASRDVPSSVQGG